MAATATYRLFWCPLTATLKLHIVGNGEQPPGPEEIVVPGVWWRSRKKGEQFAQLFERVLHCIGGNSDLPHAVGRDDPARWYHKSGAAYAELESFCTAHRLEARAFLSSVILYPRGEGDKYGGKPYST